MSRYKLLEGLNMSELSEQVEVCLKTINKMPPDRRPKASIRLFFAAVQDAEAAELFFASPNCFHDHLLQQVSFKRFIQFALRRSPELVKCLIDYAKLPSELAQTLYELNSVSILKPVTRRDLQRTIHALRYHTHIIENDIPLLIIDDKKYPLISRHTRDFTREILVSAGSHRDRETILLDPHSPLLNAEYLMLKSSLKTGLSIDVLLKSVLDKTRQLLPSTELLHAETKLVTLDNYIKQGCGVCRHHSMLNAYFLSRLVNDELLHGDVIHHRQGFSEGVHTWNLFRDARDGVLYSLDSLWNNISILSRVPGVLDALYCSTVEAVIRARHMVSGSDEFFQEKLNALKERIENYTILSRTVMFFKEDVVIQLDDGQKKQVPFALAILHQQIRTPDLSVQEKWLLIQQTTLILLKEDSTSAVNDFLCDIIDLQPSYSIASSSVPSM